MRSEYINEICNDCQEPISNPICHLCLSKEIISWFEHNLEIKNKIKKELKKEIESIERENKNREGISCVVCKKPACFFCPYCITEYVAELLKNMNAGKKIVSEFQDAFNYFEHKNCLQY